MMYSYSYFADFYDELTQNVDYEKTADYILRIAEKYQHNMGITLDLACGTGNLTVILKEKGVDIYGIDASAEMLSVAQEKALDKGLNGMLFLCQKMQNIDLFGTIDTCICTLDSINHLTSKDDVQKTFSKISFFMNPNALLIFDVNTLYKHQKILADNTYVYDTENVYCVWQNRLLKDKRTVDITLDFFEKTSNNKEYRNFYRRFSENFREYAYTHEELCEMLNKAGFELLDVFGELTFETPKESSQRNIYVAKNNQRRCSKTPV